MGTDIILTKNDKEVSNLGRVDYRGLEAYYNETIDEDYNDLLWDFHYFIIENLLTPCKEDEADDRAFEIQEEMKIIIDTAIDIGRRRLISYMLEDEGVALEVDA